MLANKGDNKFYMTTKTPIICKYVYSIVQNVSEKPTHLTFYEYSSINRIAKKTKKVKKCKKKLKKTK